MRSPETTIATCLPALTTLAGHDKNPAIWGTYGPSTPASGCAQLLERATEVAATPEGCRRWAGERALALMLLTIFPSLWPDEQTWSAFADDLGIDLTGEISRRPGKGSHVTRTALTPIELVVKYAGCY